MRLPFSWIKNHVSIDVTKEKVASILTAQGIEIDAILDERLPFKGVVVAKIEEVTQHPNADKLVVTKVNDGTSIHQVVCGAPNAKVGLVTLFAPIGALLEEGEKRLEIKATKIRGVASFGMLCAPSELGLSDDTLGIADLPETTPLGQSAAEYFADALLEISITPNLGHALSVVGIARELGAATGQQVSMPFLELATGPKEEPVLVEVQSQSDCPKYCCRIVRNVQVGQSPVWLKRRLEACGVRSVNNVVDVTNYVMLELGQPLHAFDLEKLEHRKLVVRRAVNGEELLCLDGKKRMLTEDHLIIADGTKPVAVAGVMGGEMCGVTEATKDLVLEAAYFSPSVVRRTSKDLAISTDSSKRFERGVDRSNVEFALDRAAMLLQEVAQASVPEGKTSVGATTPEKKVVHCRLSRIEKVLGIHLGLDEVETILRRLEFEVQWDGKNTFTLKVPFFRHDIQQEIDVIEEVARIMGYHHIPVKSTYYTGSLLQDTPMYVLEQAVRRRCMGQGLQEFITCDLISQKQAESMHEASAEEVGFVSVLNPSSQEQSVLRPSLLPGLLALVKHNVDREAVSIHGFELGKVYYRLQEQYKEQTMLGCVLSGPWLAFGWDRKDHLADFFDVKGVVESILGSLGLKDLSFERGSCPLYHPGRQAMVFSSGVEVGTLGQLHPRWQKEFDLTSPVLFAELKMDVLLQQKKLETKMQEIPLYPSSARDWTITLKEEAPLGHIFSLLHQVESPYLEKISLKDIYRSEKLGDRKKNVTLHFVYRDVKKTIAQETVDLEHARVTEHALKELKEFQTGQKS